MMLPGVAATLAVVAAALSFQPQNSLELLAEGGARFENRANGVMEVRGSGGWLRLPGLYSDFSVKASFRNLTADADGVLFIRSWPGKGGAPDRGYRVPMNPKVARDSSTAFLGLNTSVSVVQSDSLNLRATGEWQQLEVTAKGRTVTLTINGQPVGAYEIEELTGEILLVNRKGKMEFRDISVQAAVMTYSHPAGTVPVLDLKARGGVSPKLLREVKPNYSRDAMQAKVQGNRRHADSRPR